MHSKHLWYPLWPLVNADMVFDQAHVALKRQVCACLFRQDIFVELDNLGAYGQTSLGESHSCFLLVSCLHPKRLQRRGSTIPRYPKLLLLVLLGKSSFPFICTAATPALPSKALLSVHFPM